jgi:orotate phosphoribosyltransferase-like protein
LENLEIRILVKNNGLKYKDIADEMNICPEHLSRLLRKEMTIENKIRVMRAIDQLRKGAEADDV